MPNKVGPRLGMDPKAQGIRHFAPRGSLLVRRGEAGGKRISSPTPDPSFSSWSSAGIRRSSPYPPLE